MRLKSQQSFRSEAQHVFTEKVNKVNKVKDPYKKYHILIKKTRE